MENAPLKLSIPIGIGFILESHPCYLLLYSKSNLNIYITNDKLKRKGLVFPIDYYLLKHIEM